VDVFTLPRMPLNEPDRAEWDERHRGKTAGEAEPFPAAMLARIQRGVALDVAAGRGRNALALARAGLAVVAVDYSSEAMRLLAATARTARLAIWPVVANLDSFHLKDESLDAIVNTNFLDRALFPKFERALRLGGILIADTFLVDQAEFGHPRDPRFLLGHGELRALAGGLEVEEYREGLVTYPNGERAFRASIAARRRKSA
jgi:SAM-dependent methyltransferase